jgi:4-amino-4-deoxy-L-arabinose transferase-like glycosyltransferase
VTALLLILRYLHLVGFALLFGGAVAQYLTGTLRINQAMLWGATAQVVTGIALAAPLRGDNPEPPVAKIVVKLVLGLTIFAMVFFSRRRPEVNRGHFLAIVGLALVTAGVGTFWR